MPRLINETPIYPNLNVFTENCSNNWFVYQPESTSNSSSKQHIPVSSRLTASPFPPLVCPRDRPAWAVPPTVVFWTLTVCSTCQNFLVFFQAENSPLLFLVYICGITNELMIVWWNDSGLFYNLYVDSARVLIKSSGLGTWRHKWSPKRLRSC